MIFTVITPEGGGIRRAERRREQRRRGEEQAGQRPRAPLHAQAMEGMSNGHRNLRAFRMLRSIQARLAQPPSWTAFPSHASLSAASTRKSATSAREIDPGTGSMLTFFT